MAYHVTAILSKFKRFLSRMSISERQSPEHKYNHYRLVPFERKSTLWQIVDIIQLYCKVEAIDDLHITSSRW